MRHCTGRTAKLSKYAFCQLQPRPARPLRYVLSCASSCGLPLMRTGYEFTGEAQADLLPPGGGDYDLAGLERFGLPVQFPVPVLIETEPVSGGRLVLCAYVRDAAVYGGVAGTVQQRIRLHLVVGPAGVSHDGVGPRILVVTPLDSFGRDHLAETSARSAGSVHHFKDSGLIDEVQGQGMLGLRIELVWSGEG